MRRVLRRPDPRRGELLSGRRRWKPSSHLSEGRRQGGVEPRRLQRFRRYPHDGRRRRPSRVPRRPGPTRREQASTRADPSRDPGESPRRARSRPSSGIIKSSTAASNGPSRRAPASASARAPAANRPSSPSRVPRGDEPPVGVVVVDYEHPAAASARRGGPRSAPLGLAPPDLDVELPALSRYAVARRPTVPPISSVSRRLMASPRPVPP